MNTVHHAQDERAASVANCSASPQPAPSGYVLLTAAYNEEQYIEATIQSVVAQTAKPLAWVIVSDGSTDQTDSIIQRYCGLYNFISYFRMERDPEAHTPEYGAVASRKVNALSSGLQTLAHLPYAYLAVIDADVTIAPDFFAALLRKMESDDALGIGGGFIFNIIPGREVPAFVNPRNVGGPMQMFRRACWEAIGGYVPYAHEDTVALIMARMKGWRTQSFADLKVLHHKTATWYGRKRWKAKYKLGVYDCIMGDTVLWEILRCAKEIPQSPAILGSCLRFVGYCKGVVSEKKVLPQEVLKFVRREQLSTLRTTVLDRMFANH
jgi:glycosyltransferase involved in cell wall biosynthesis